MLPGWGRVWRERRQDAGRPKIGKVQAEAKDTAEGLAWMPCSQCKDSGPNRAVQAEATQTGTKDLGVYEGVSRSGLPRKLILAGGLCAGWYFMSAHGP